eukprot:12507467-Ditylum_brightwellii.AAC.2
MDSYLVVLDHQVLHGQLLVLWIGSHLVGLVVKRAQLLVTVWYLEGNRWKLVSDRAVHKLK